MNIVSQAATQIQEMVPLQGFTEVGNIDIYEKVFGIDRKKVSIREVSGIIETLEFKPENLFEAEQDVLGTYQPMASPGKITLYWERIGGFFWHTLLEISHHHNYIELEEVTRLIELTVHKTYSHEKFHHACDVGRHLFGGGKNHLTEEALAVAWSYHHLNKLLSQKRYAMINRPLVGDFLERIYKYTAPGYRDWAKYSDQRMFYSGVSEYLVPAPALKTLSGGRVDLMTIMRSFISEVERGQATLDMNKP